MNEEILSALSVRYHIQQKNFNVLGADCLYELSKQFLFGELSFYLFVTNSNQHVSTLAEKIETVLENLPKPTSIICILPYMQKLRQRNDEVLVLFNERYHSFVHFIYFDNKVCNYSTDFYYHRSREIKWAMKCIEGVLVK